MDESCALKSLPLLIKISRCNNHQRRLALRYAPNSFIDALSELCVNLIYHRVPLDEKQKALLNKHKKTLQLCADPRHPVEKRRKVISQRGGALLGTILSLALPTIVELAAKKLYQVYQEKRSK